MNDDFPRRAASRGLARFWAGPMGGQTATCKTVWDNRRGLGTLLRKYLAY